MKIISYFFLFVFLFLLPASSFSQNRDVYTKKFELNSNEGDSRKVLFLGSSGASALGIRSFGSTNINFGAYYSPNLLFKLNEISSLSLGSNLQVSVYPNFSFSLPLLLGYQSGTLATEDSDKEFGFFICAGVNYVNLLDNYPGEDVRFIGPAIDMGLRFFEIAELHFSASKQFNNPQNAFFYSVGLGLAFNNN